MRAPRTGISAAALAAAAVPTFAQLAPVNDDFDCYQAGDLLSSLPGWEHGAWGGAGEARIAGMSHSGALSVQLPEQRMHLDRPTARVEAGQITVRLMTFVPGAATEAYPTVMAWAERPATAPPYGLWGLWVGFDTAYGQLRSTAGMGTASRPMIVDRWVELRFEIDLDAERYSTHYDGERWIGGRWPETGDVLIRRPSFEGVALTVERAAGPGIYIDDLVVTEAGATPPPTCGVICYADCDNSGAIDFFDFLCFQNLFGAGDARADCDADGELTFFDFLCYQNQFAAGCP